MAPNPPPEPDLEVVLRSGRVIGAVEYDPERDRFGVRSIHRVQDVRLMYDHAEAVAWIHAEHEQQPQQKQDTEESRRARQVRDHLESGPLTGKEPGPMSHDTHPSWCVTQPRCALGHSGPERVIAADYDSPTAISVRLWQLTARQERPVLLELGMTTFRGTRHVAALSLGQAGDLAEHVADLVKLAGGR